MYFKLYTHCYGEYEEKFDKVSEFCQQFCLLRPALISLNINCVIGTGVTGETDNRTNKRATYGYVPADMTTDLLISKLSDMESIQVYNVFVKPKIF